MNPIRHLYNRFCFGLPPERWAELPKQSLEQAREQIFESAKSIKALAMPAFDIPSENEMESMSEDKKKELRREAERLTMDVNLAWLQQMAMPQHAFREKMTLFWHGHFACESKAFHLAVKQNNALRQHALGNFKDLVLAVAKDASMIFYLNNQQNRKKSPNENFARELMELFTLGRGNYTENDIKEAARAFTGWFADRKTATFAFDEKNHDSGSKTFMGKTGNWNGEDIIQIILEQKQAAIFIAQKVYRFFVNDSPNPANIELIADAFRKSNYDIMAMMQALAKADFFYASENCGNKICSPIELLVRYQQLLQLKFGEAKEAILLQRALGQVLFMPPNVAGWAGGKAWMDNATLLIRLNLPMVFFQSAEINFKSKDDPEEAQAKDRIKSLQSSINADFLIKKLADKKAEEWAEWLLAMPYEYKGSAVEKFADAASSEERERRRLLAFMSLPEFQLI